MPSGKSIYTLKEPCSNCPFRSDKPFYLNRGRAEGIAESLEMGATFWCHKTLDYSEPEFDECSDEEPEYDGSGRVVKKSRACAGSLITMEKEDNPNQIMQIAERLGLYDRTQLNMDSPVFDSIEEWVESFGRFDS